MSLPDCKHCRMGTKHTLQHKLALPYTLTSTPLTHCPIPTAQSPSPIPLTPNKKHSQKLSPMLSVHCTLHDGQYPYYPLAILCTQHSFPQRLTYTPRHHNKHSCALPTRTLHLRLPYPIILLILTDEHVLRTAPV